MVIGRRKPEVARRGRSAEWALFPKPMSVEEMKEHCSLVTETHECLRDEAAEAEAVRKPERDHCLALLRVSGGEAT